MFRLRIVAVSICLFVLSQITFAGGLDISGFGAAYENMFKVAEKNRQILVEAQTGPNLCTSDDGDSKSGFGADQYAQSLYGGLKAIKMTYEDGSVVYFFPVANEMKSNQKDFDLRTLHVIGDNKGLSLISRDIEVNDRMAHENSVLLKWRGSDGVAYPIKNLEVVPSSKLPKSIGGATTNESMCNLQKLAKSNSKLKSLLIDPSQKPEQSGTPSGTFK